jgi:hypothetical protein
MDDEQKKQLLLHYARVHCAIHEASHAAAALHVARPVLFVEVQYYPERAAAKEPGYSGDGRVIMHPDTPPDLRADLFVSLAGPEMSKSVGVNAGFQHDLKNVTALVGKLDPDTAARVQQEANDRAKQFVRDSRLKILHVACVLLRESKLQADRARYFLEKTTHPAGWKRFLLDIEQLPYAMQFLEWD